MLTRFEREDPFDRVDAVPSPDADLTSPASSIEQVVRSELNANFWSGHNTEWLPLPSARPDSYMAEVLRMHQETPISRIEGPQIPATLPESYPHEIVIQCRNEVGSTFALSIQPNGSAGVVRVIRRLRDFPLPTTAPCAPGDVIEISTFSGQWVVESVTTNYGAGRDGYVHTTVTA